MSNNIQSYCLIALISHTTKVMPKILQARLQQYVNRELPDVHTGFRKCRATRDQLFNLLWIIEKARELQKNIYFCFIDFAKAFDCVDHNKLWKILKEMRLPDNLICLMRNLYADQEVTVRTKHGTMYWLPLGKENDNAVYCHLSYLIYMQSSVQFSSVAQLCPTLCDPMNRSMPGLPVHHQLPEFTQTHIR